jgi:pyruvate dehydrogenase E2 component (dihydrolipoamide acetyltransferase)
LAAAVAAAAMTATPEQRKAVREPRSKLRAIIGRRMTEAKQQVPHFYVTIEIDAGPLMDLRKQFNALLSEDEKLSINDFIVKAAALNLQRFPALNVSLDGDQLVRHAQVNVGVAVALEDGLLTVVVHDADQKAIRQIGSESRIMIERARAGRVRPEDIEGSTFTVSNMGMFDVDHFIAIVNPPEAAIMAVGSVQQVPVVEDGKLAIGRRMKVTLSADHRITDGAEAARWLQSFAQMLEQPLQLVVS